MKIVVDTNIFIAWLLKSVPCQKIFLLVKEGRLQLFISPLLFDELKTTLHRPKFRNLITASETKAVVNFIDAHAQIIKPKITIKECRDPKDNPVLETAIESCVHFIVTGDKDLLVLSPFRNIAIVSPKDFLKRLNV